MNIAPSKQYALLSPLASYKNAFIFLAVLFVTVLSLSTVLAASGSWTSDGDGNWNDNANWDGGTFPNGAGETAAFGSAITAPRTVTIDSTQITIDTVTFDSAQSYRLTSANSGGLSVDNALTGTLGDHTIDLPLTLDAHIDVNQNISGSLTLNGNIDESTNNRKINKNGAGTLTLNGNNSYGGHTTVNAGTLVIGSDTAVGTNTLTTQNNTTIEAAGGPRILANNLDFASKTTFTGDPLSFTHTGIRLNGSREITVNNITSLARIKDPANGRNLRLFGTGTFNLNMSDGFHPVWIRTGDYNAATATDVDMNLYVTGEVGRVIYLESGGLFAPGDVYDVATSTIITGTDHITTDGELVLHENTILNLDLNGPTIGSGYDSVQYGVSPSGGCDCVALNDATLNIDLGYEPAADTVFTILSRAEGGGEISGTFKDLPQGTVFEVDGTQFVINYLPIGGPVTEVQLTVIGTPSEISTIEATSGSGQTAAGDTQFTENLVTTIYDSEGNPVSNALVTFDSPASGATATFLTPQSGLTAADGTYSVTVQANDIGGTYNISATVDAPMVAPAVFTLTNEIEISYTLSVNIVGSGTVTPTAGTYPADTVVNLAATAAEGWQFADWSGDFDSTDTPTALTMDSDKVITATFSLLPPPPTYTLEINMVGSGTVTPTSGTYTANDVVTLTAAPDAGWQFAGWSGDLSGMTNPADVTMNGDKVITATFSQIPPPPPPPTYTLTINIIGNGTVTPTSSVFTEGELVTLTATAAEGWRFAGWSGDFDSTDNPASLTMNGDKVITATFSAEPIPTYTLTINAVGNGTVTPLSSTFTAGEQVTLNATAAEGWQFAGWSGDLISTDNPAVVTMDSDKAITATFSEIVYNLYLPIVVVNN